MQNAKRLLMLAVLAALTAGCNTLAYKKAFVATHEAIDAVVGITETNSAPLPAGQAPILWDAYYCAGWTGHNDQANLDRDAGIKACKATGKTAIGFKFKDDSGAFKIAVYHWPSNVDGHFQEYPENWTDRARVDAGVTRWVVSIADCEPVAVADTFKAYGPNTDYQVQFTGIPITREVMKALGCDGNGVKITPPVER